MFTTIFSIFVWPIQAVIQVLFLFFEKMVSGNHGWTIVLISLAVNFVLLPIYRVAERWQKEEGELLRRMKPKLDDIRAVFEGDQRHFMVNTYYRQMGYRPLLSLRSSLGLLIQIPFFLAAYDFLSHAEVLKAASFFFLEDLSKPDALLSLGGLPINVLPFVMTALNLWSGFLYSKDLALKDKVQPAVLALVFLFLLYGSPSGLVLYWTVSNAFSLLKNLSASARKPGRIAHLGAMGVVAAVTILPSSGLFGPFRWKQVLLGLLLLPLLGVIPWLYRRLLRTANRLRSLAPQPQDFKVFVLASANLALLAGLVIPALLIQSSPQEFGPAAALLFQTLLQSLSLFVLVPLALWMVAGPDLRRLLVPLVTLVAVLVLIDTFVFPSAGAMNRTFTFTDPDEIRSTADLWTTLSAFAVSLAVVTLSWRFGRRAWAVSLLSIGAITMGATGVVSLFLVAQVPPVPAPVPRNVVEPAFHLSATQTNVFVVFLDRAVGVAFPKVLEKQPSLAAAFGGFVFYPNTLSFGQGTSLGAPALFGGYEYSPEGMVARKDQNMLAKINESLKVMPALFSQAGYRVAISDPPYANLHTDPPDISIYQGMKNVTGWNLKGVYKQKLLNDLGLEQELLPEHQRFDYDILIRFSLFRMAPPVARSEVYRNGIWWHANKVNNDFDFIMKSFSTLHYLPELTAIDSDQPTFNLLSNDTTHENGSFGADFRPTPWEIFIPAEDSQRFGDVDSVLKVYNEGAALTALARWFDALKVAGVWDRTMIVVVADHGVEIDNEEIRPGFERFNPLLLVKPLGAQGPLQISQEFMTNADVPSLVAKVLGGGSNAFTGKPLTSESKNGKIVVHYAPTNTPHAEWVSVPPITSWELEEKSIFTKTGWKELR